MVRIRHGWLVAVIGLALPLATACKKDEKKSDSTGDQSKAGGDGIAEKQPESAKPADDLSLLPVDSELVMGINTAQIQASPVWKQLVEPKVMTGDALKRLTEFKDKCGMDPMTSVQSISMGLKPSAGKPEGTVVLHGVDKSKAWTCLDNMKAEITKDGSEYTRDGDVGLIKGKNGEQVAFTFITNDTGLAVFGTNATAAGIKTVAAGGSALKSSQAFVEMYGKVNTKDSVWMLVNGRVLDRFAALGIKPKAIFGSLNVTDGLAMDGRMVLESPEAAAEVTTLAKGQAAQLEKMVDKVDVTNDGAEVRMQVVMSNQKLQALISQFGAMLGAFGGGMGH